MAIVYDKLLALDIPEVEQAYTEKDTILYALGVGCGHDPVDETELAFVYEKNLKALPTMPLVLGVAPLWLRSAGVNWTKVVDGERGIILHRPLAPHGAVVGKTRVVEAIDKGEGKGALVYSERTVIDKASGDLIATLTQTTFCRGDGGFGGPAVWSKAGQAPVPHPIPDRTPDRTDDIAIHPEMALIYRLSGDINPLHVEPEFAKAAGFPKPILHGLATFGVAGRAILKAVCDYQPERLTAMKGRFSGPVYPGETLRTELWQEKNKD
ncbi:MAG: MaoC family dehydratase N-terminal domain-containing protein, partial [Pseudolabrys sp.]|nr:MaoC family dehydratase N-terminal domain-containing protein [Pseudolabrys sp.]